jgi:hypothetical protein
MFGIKFDQDVHVAVLPLIAPHVRAKESQPRDPELSGQTWPCLLEYAKNVLRAFHGVVPPRVTGGSADRVRWVDWGEAAMLAFVHTRARGRAGRHPPAVRRCRQANLMLVSMRA